MINRKMILRHYENIMIITPILSDDQARETAKEYEDYLIKKNGKIIYTEHWGLKKLAYSIQKKKSGCYHLIEFLLEPNLIYNLDLKLNQDERIIRYLTIKMNKHAIEYAKIRKKKLKNGKKHEN